MPHRPELPGRADLSVAPGRHYGLGLRAQTLLALTAAFLVSFSALSIVIVSAAQKSQELERARRAQQLAEAVGATLAVLDARAREHALAGLIGHGGVQGAELTQRSGSLARFGDPAGRASVEAQLADGGRLALWTRSSEAEQASPLARLLRLYALLTGSLMLLVVYVVLTRVIVRPVELLTGAVERLPLAAGDATLSIPGTAELARLAVAFNAMTRELRRDRSALEARLAELETTTRELRATQEQLIRSEKLAGVGRLAAGVAHEIGNPLAAILGLVEILQLGATSRGEEAEFLARIRSETERIHHIIRDLLDYARLRPDEPGRAASADVERVVEEAVALIAPQKDLRRVTIERRVYESDLQVRAPAHELTQLVLNLLLNAADAVAGEGQILIEVRRDDGAIELAISDTGPGIAPAVRDQLFDPFVTTKPAGKGTGLGLAVCHAIVERLGGSIRGENLPRRGARFTVRLPVSK